MATTTSQGRYLGSDVAFKARKGKSISSSLRLSAQRKDSLEKKAIDDKRNQEQAKAKEISRREKERQGMRKELQKRVSEETNPNRNTDERRKVVNVGRPDTAKNPMDTRSKLAKQGEIKTKIIENEVRSMTLQKYHNLPDSLVSAVKDVLEGKNPFAKDDKAPKKDDDKDDKKPSAKKDDDADDEDDDKDTKSKKKDDDDDDDDRQIGKGGKKTKVDVNPTMKMANEELKGGQKKLDKNHNGKLDAQDFKMLRKEEVELDEGMEYDGKGHSPMPKMNQPSMAAHKQAAKWHAGHYEQATNSKEKNMHKERMQHHTSQAQAMKSMGVKEEVTLSDEEHARILAKLNEADDDDEKHDGPEHIIMQLRKAKSLGAANRPIHFHDGSKVKVHGAHVQKALDMHGSFKKAPEKDEFTQKLQASHASFKKAIGEG